MADLASSLISRAENINYILVTAFGLLIGTALIKLSHQTIITVKGVKIDISKIQLIMAALTIAHLYTAFSFHMKAKQIINEHPQEVTHSIFDELSDSKTTQPFFQGLLPRVVNGRVLVMSYQDPTTYLTVASAVFAFVVMSRWRLVSTLERLKSIIGSGVIVGCNWLIGTWWAVEASCLVRREICSAALAVLTHG